MSNAILTQKRVAIVTGAAQGLGKEVCRQLSAQGIEVILTARNEQKGMAAARELSANGRPVRFHRLDVTSPDQIETLLGFVRREYDRLDILVNNAGIFPEKGSSWELGEA